MKIHKYAWNIVLLALFCIGVAASRQDTLDSVIGALKNGNASQLPDQSSQLGKSQAQAAITKFFSTYTVTGFELKHRGNAPGGAFAMGTLLTEKGQFRVNVFMSPGGPKEGVRELRIQTMD
jgi:hypothetical protein